MSYNLQYQDIKNRETDIQHKGTFFQLSVPVVKKLLSIHCSSAVETFVSSVFQYSRTFHQF